MKHYLYLHYRYDKEEIFYVGIGTKTKEDLKYNKYHRAYDFGRRSDFWKKIKAKTNIRVIILDHYDNYSELKKEEIRLIKHYGRRDLGTGTLVNLTDGGEGVVGYKPTKETLEKQSKSMIGKNIGKKASFITKAKMSIKHRGNKYRLGQKASKETKDKMSKAHLGHSRLKGYKQSKDHIHNAKIGKYKPVVGIDDSGNIIKSYKAAKLAKIDGFDPSTITNCCKGKRKRHKNLIWKYA